MLQRKKYIWQFPWAYTEALIIAAGLFVSALFLEWVTGNEEFKMLPFPTNVILIMMLCGFLVYVYSIFGKNPVVRFLSGIPAAISSILLLGLLVLMMGLIPQHNSLPAWQIRMGFHHISQSWTMAFAILYVLVCLGLTILKHARKLNLRNSVFLLNHLGLFILLIAAIAGKGDLKRYTAMLRIGQTVYTAANEKENISELPIALKLNRFHIDYYLPKLAVIDLLDSSLVVKNTSALPEISEEKTFEAEGWKISILQTIDEGRPTDTSFIAENQPGAVAGALVKAIHSKTGEIKTGWISHGSFTIPPKILPLTNQRAITMTVPQPRKYISYVTVYTKKGKIFDDSIMVNHPVKAMGFNIYQLSYNTRLGKYSETSVVELVRDPWLPVVYTALLMLIIGAAGLFFTGKNFKY